MFQHGAYMEFCFTFRATSPKCILSIYLWISIYLSIYLSIHPSIYLCILCIYIYMYIYNICVAFQIYDHNKYQTYVFHPSSSILGRRRKCTPARKMLYGYVWMSILSLKQSMWHCPPPKKVVLRTWIRVHESTSSRSSLTNKTRYQEFGKFDVYWSGRVYLPAINHGVLENGPQK